MKSKRLISAFTAIAVSICSFIYTYPVSGSSVLEDSYIPGNGGGYIHMPYEKELAKQQTDDNDSQVLQAANLPSHYDLRDEGAVTPVRNQGAEGMCHAFSALGACESNILKQGFETDPSSLDLSEAQLGYFLYTKQTDPSDPLYGDYLDSPGKGSSGGNGLLAAAGLASGIGTEKEEFCRYSDWSKGYSEYDRYAGQYRLRICENIVRATDSASKNKIKSWLMESGAVGFAFFSQRSLYYDNGTSYSLYAKDKSYYEDANHAALIVGWDDDYSKENFSPDGRPSNDGAWLVKNSYGPDLFDDGYFWISYEDPSMGSFLRYIMERASDHDDIYEYDGAGYITAYSFDAAANVFTAEYDCTLTDVSFYMPAGNPSNTSYEVDVYRLKENTDDPTDGERIGSASGTIQNSGYYTVPLDDTADLLKGEQFSLVLTMSAKLPGQTVYLPIEEKTDLSGIISIECNANPGESYAYVGGIWEDTSMNEGELGEFGNIPLKAFAVRNEEYSPSILQTALKAAEGSNLSSTVLADATDNGRFLLESGAGANSCRRAANTIFSELEKLGGNVHYPEYIYDDYNVIIGDSNEDGLVTLDDASDVLSYYAIQGAGMTYRLRRKQKIVMNAVYDYSIDISDATEILSIYAKRAAGLE